MILKNVYIMQLKKFKRKITKAEKEVVVGKIYILEESVALVSTRTEEESRCGWC